MTRGSCNEDQSIVLTATKVIFYHTEVFWLKQDQTLLRYASVLSRLIELDEGIDALEAAIEFKNDGIATQQKELDSGKLLTDKDREGLINKLSNLSQREATALLSKYFEKVVELRGSEKKLELHCSDLEVSINESAMG